MGRKKIDTSKMIADKGRRTVTFTKRRQGLFKKAANLAKLSQGTEITIIVFSASGKMFHIGDTSLIDDLPSSSASPSSSEVVQYGPAATSLKGKEKLHDDNMSSPSSSSFIDPGRMMIEYRQENPNTRCSTSMDTGYESQENRPSSIDAGNDGVFQFEENQSGSMGNLVVGNQLIEFQGNPSASMVNPNANLGTDFCWGDLSVDQGLMLNMDELTELLNFNYGSEEDFSYGYGSSASPMVNNQTWSAGGGIPATDFCGATYEQGTTDYSRFFSDSLPAPLF